jgi:hypothetical protein
MWPILSLLLQFPPQAVSVAIDQHLLAIVAGDGTYCALDRTPAVAVPSLQFTCTTPGLIGPQLVTMQPEITHQGYFAQVGDVVCWISMNPLSSPMQATFYQSLNGSLVPPATVTPFALQVPASGAAWACVTNIWDGGVVVAQTAMITGRAIWP